ncbi:hypothetical protein [Photorhabdus stackebrandtii]|uniref:Uncharacterized protein n=1 Tax=Photorhabdus stackebrandtii TaxID=1123042 RepID=A0A7X5QK89_9GAMM|nr:hypothetical protein [Photorhabdus stackebrandtii]NHB95859.1 hypothetical protein [Photorhabdus stackebrandtii]
MRIFVATRSRLSPATMGTSQQGNYSREQNLALVHCHADKTTIAETIKHSSTTKEVNHGKL